MLKVNTSFYRKPTQTDRVIDSNKSNHPLSNKMSAFNNFIYKLKILFMTPQDYTAQLNTIKKHCVNKRVSTSNLKRNYKTKNQSDRVKIKLSDKKYQVAHFYFIKQMILIYKIN